MYVFEIFKFILRVIESVSSNFNFFCLFLGISNKFVV